MMPIIMQPFEAADTGPMPAMPAMPLTAATREPRELRFGTTVPQFLMPLAPLLGMLTISGLFGTHNGLSVTERFLPPLIGVGIAMALVWRQARKPTVVLTYDTLFAINFRKRRIPLADIQAIRAETRFGTKQVVVYEASGRRTRLRAPMTGILAWDRGFDDKFHAIGRWWLDHRGASWTPVYPPGFARPYLPPPSNRTG